MPNSNSVPVVQRQSLTVECPSCGQKTVIEACADIYGRRFGVCHNSPPSLFGAGNHDICNTRIPLNNSTEVTLTCPHCKHKVKGNLSNSGNFLLFVCPDCNKPTEF